MKSGRFYERLAYLRPAVKWSIRFERFGPRWVPLRVRKLPLFCLAAIVGFYA